MTRIILLFLIALHAFLGAYSQNHNHLMDSLFNDSENVVTPGYTISILQESEVVYQKLYGYTNVKEKVKFDSDSRFAIASCSKQFTAYCILLLEQENRLELTDNIRKYIPELPEYSSPIQIKHLLSHTSGIRDHIVMLGWTKNQKEKYYNFKGTIESLKKFNGLSFHPGERFAYSNTGYVLLALIVEKVSGISFEEFAKQHIFKPLEMKDTEFSFRRKFEEYGSINPYGYDPKKKKYKEFKHLEVNALGATGVYTTTSDYILWDKHLSEPPKKYEEIVNRMFTPDTLSSGKTVYYNFGFKRRKYNGHDIIEHAGGWANYNFQYTRIPDKRVSIIIASNNDNHYPIGMANEILEKLIPECLTEIETTPAILPDKFLTNYFCADFTSACIIKGKQEYAIQGEDLYPIEHYDILLTKNNVLIDAEGNHLEFNKMDTSFNWYGGSYFHTPRHFTTNTPIQIGEIENYAGVYYAEELGELKIEYRKKTGEFKIKSSFGKNPITIVRVNRLLKLKGPYSLFLTNKNEVLLGDSRVSVKFYRVE